MLKGIYFLETNSSVLSDMEGCFTINDAFVYKGGCGVIREAVKQLEKMQDVSFIVISDRLIDGTCEEALEQFSTISAQMIVATSTRDELMRTRLAKRQNCCRIRTLMKSWTLCSKRSAVRLPMRTARSRTLQTAIFPGMWIILFPQERKRRTHPSRNRLFAKVPFRTD